MSSISRSTLLAAWILAAFAAASLTVYVAYYGASILGAFIVSIFLVILLYQRFNKKKYWGGAWIIRICLGALLLEVGLISIDIAHINFSFLNPESYGFVAGLVFSLFTFLALAGLTIEIISIRKNQKADRGLDSDIIM